MDVALFLRSSAKQIPDAFDEYREYLSMASTRCEPEFGAMGAVGFHYQSAKDSLRELGMSVKRHRGEVMAIGRLLYLDAKDFAKAQRAASAAQFEDLTAEQINQLAGV